MTTPYRTKADVEQEKPQPFPLEKILTVNARDYCESVGKKLSDYEMRGVHTKSFKELESFAMNVPPNTEVVVDYMSITTNYSTEYYQLNASGTALIPKPPKRTTEGGGPR